MKPLVIDENKARKLYPTAPPEWKTTLEDSFGKEFFSLKIEDRIHSLEDACKENGTTLDEVVPFKNPTTPKQLCVNAFASMIEIIQAFNEQQIPDWRNPNQYKRYAWWNMDGASGFGRSFSGGDCGDSDTNVASRLQLLKLDHVKIVADRFKHIYEPLMTQKSN